MALTSSDTLKEFFGDQPDASRETSGSVADVMGSMHARMASVLGQYGAKVPEIDAALSRIHDRAIHIATLAESAPDTTAGKLHAMRIEVMTGQTMDKIERGMTAREAQQMDYLRGLLGANDSGPVSAPDALTA